MKIVIVTHNVIKGDGQGRANFEITRRALELGHSVTLVADRVDESLVQSGADWIRVQPRFLRKVNLIKCVLFAREADALLRNKLSAKADVVHGYGYTLTVQHDVNTSQFVHSAWRRSPVHTARLQRGPGAAYQWLYSAVNARWEAVSYGRARHVVAASHTVYDELAQLGIARDQLSVVLNGVDLTEFKPEPRSSRAELGLPEGHTLALFVGDIRSPRKNLDSVLKSLVRVPDLHLVVVGRVDGSPFPQMAHDLGVADRTHFLDYRRDVADIMRACDFFVFPSRYEACSLVILEAIASGLPVITARTTGGSEVLTDACGIILDETDNLDKLGAAMAQMTNDPVARKRMAEQARVQAELYSWDTIADQYIALYEKVCSGDRKLEYA